MPFKHEHKRSKEANDVKQQFAINLLLSVCCSADHYYVLHYYITLYYIITARRGR
jgi:hypothetical protein